ncbi:Fpg/Nei family DNA glycosylase [Fimbriimonas ginsengisoli]|uniref:DNA-formamidopyrimidine glycosylase n=1 Tax=Fimbriimonas ginsengisoli Gsoil 348 TaxID=661478 RepID=A0A068NWH7_FIMGI|nr:DNA-formamidopyrimidine glycosylase family protein [Fimbriimonas ginsengisoli]AIE87806.1 DNA-formamidopyrimidine glycosylase [Fimbriimonas ginsengisoli Gsoil 348]
MPEFPDIELYRVRLAERIVGSNVESLTFFNPFVLRSYAVAPQEFTGLKVVGIERLGKRIVIAVENERFIVIHLMVAGRLQWQSPAPDAKRATGKIQLAAFRFSTGLLSLIESSTRKRASIHLVAGRAGLAEHERGGLNLMDSTPAEFAQRLRATNRTLKRALTDPRTFDGIGNAYSDEILFAARISPVRTTGSLKDEEVERLHRATVETLIHWTEKLQRTVPGFPKNADVTAFRPDFAVHNRFGHPCPNCGAPIQHIVYAENETNYCARCQNEGRLLADRSLSRLLKDDWPKTLEEMLGG